MKNPFLLFILVTIFFTSTLMAQDQSDATKGSIMDDDISSQIQPVSELMTIAEQNSPLLKFYNAAVIIAELKIKSEKNDWMQNLGFDSDVRYGLFDNLIINQALGREDYTTSSTTQTRYAVGVYLKIPLLTITNRKNMIRQAEQETEKAMFQREVAVKELRQLVIVQFNNLLKAHRLMQIAVQNRETFKVQSIRAEQDFVNGLISISEYSRLQEMLTRSIENYESQKFAYITAYMLLEETVGVKLKR